MIATVVEKLEIIVRISLLGGGVGAGSNGRFFYYRCCAVGGDARSLFAGSRSASLSSCGRRTARGSKVYATAASRGVV